MTNLLEETRVARATALENQAQIVDLLKRLEIDITPKEALILYTIYVDKPPHQKTIALAIGSEGLTWNMRRLSKLGLVKRIRAHKDLRLAVPTLTLRGIAYIEQIMSEASYD